MEEVVASLALVEKHGKDQVQGKSGISILLKINILLQGPEHEGGIKLTQIARKSLDWRGEGGILALGGEEC